MKYILLTGLLFLVAIFTLQLRNISKPASKPIATVTPSKMQKKNNSYNISQGETPQIPFSIPQGFTIHVFASGLGNPRDLQFSPGGTLLVSNPSSNEVIALPDKNNDGVADSKNVIIRNQPHAHGLAFFNNKLYVAGVTQVAAFDWDEATLAATNPHVLFPLPQNDDHNNRTIVFDTSGNMYVSVGSTCNVCNETPLQGGSVWISNAQGKIPQIFATGLRNAAFLAINPTTGELWATEMGRDYLGDTTPPDEINIIRQGENFGWPDCFGNKIHDTQFDKSSGDPCIHTQSPIFEISAHSAPLGIVFINSPQFPQSWQGDLLIAYHGSWNRSVPTGYKIVHMKVQGNTIVNAEDFLTGFLQGNNQLGRPVDMTFDSKGNLFISDDKSGSIYILQKSN